MLFYARNFIAEEENPWGSVASQICKLQVWWETLSQKKVENDWLRKTPGIDICTPWAYMYTHACSHMCVHTRMHAHLWPDENLHSCDHLLSVRRAWVCPGWLPRKKMSRAGHLSSRGRAMFLLASQISFSVYLDSQTPVPDTVPYSQRLNYNGHQHSEVY